jgi:ABC-type phosphate/phosphonate transport system permease subunit
MDTNLPLMQYTHQKAMPSREVGEELAYPSLAAACLTAVLVLLLSGTVGQFLMEHNALERFLNDWLSFLPPFLDIFPTWAREAPFILGGIALVAIVTVRLLASVLPAIALYLLAVAVACALALLAPPTRLPVDAEDWIFVCYVTLTAFMGGAPKPYEDRI